jgi:YVTN family beta-propeller protein
LSHLARLTGKLTQISRQSQDFSRHKSLDSTSPAHRRRYSNRFEKETTNFQIRKIKYEKNLVSPASGFERRLFTICGFEPRAGFRIFRKNGRRALAAFLCASLCPALFCWKSERAVKADSGIGSVTAGENPSAVSVNAATNKIYVVNEDSNSIRVIDGTNDSATTVVVGTKPFAAAVNPFTGKVYVPNRDSVSVTVITPAPTTAIPRTRLR